MRPTNGHIGDLTATATSRVQRLNNLAAGLGNHVGASDRRLISYIVIEAANLWAQYSRSLFLSCAFGARDASGQPVVATPCPSEHDALTVAVHAVVPKLRGTNNPWNDRLLPDFQNKGKLSRTIDYLGASVSKDVDAALSVQSRVLADLPTMRNFFAHKGERGVISARALAPRYGLSAHLAPEQLLCAVPPAGSGDVLLREWLADLNGILSLMP